MTVLIEEAREFAKLCDADEISSPYRLISELRIVDFVHAPEQVAEQQSENRVFLTLLANAFIPGAFEGAK